MFFRLFARARGRFVSHSFARVSCRPAVASTTTATTTTGFEFIVLYRYVRLLWRSRMIVERGCAHSFACARKPFARVTRRANVILNDASAARASAGCARACARVMVWGVVVRDRARTGDGARSRARIVCAHRGRSVPSRMMPTRREISRVANVRVARRVRWGIARAHGREGVEDICLHACASRTCVIARRGGRGRGECVIENSCAPQGDEVARGVHVTPCGSARMAYISR